MGKRTGRGWRIAGCLFAGLAAFIVGTYLDTVLSRYWHHRFAPLVDDLITGLLIGGLLLLYEERLHRSMMRKLKTVAEINHIVRNDLEIMQYSAHVTGDREHMERIRTCVQHIEWALREVLPGEEGEIHGAAAAAKRPAARTSTSSDNRSQSGTA